jgi:hypothetical protein
MVMAERRIDSGDRLDQGFSPKRLCHAENEVPQPQVPVALGLANLKPPP